MSRKKPKKKKSILKRILKIIGIFIVVIIAALILIPVFFKDEIKELAIAEANKMLKAEVALGDFDLTLITSFPEMKIVFDDVSITGKNEFEGVKLVDLKSFEAELGFWSVINMEDIEIRSVRLIEPDIHVKVLPNGVANYDIMKSTEEIQEEQGDTTSSPFKLSLQYYEIKDGNIIYDDRLGDMYAKIKNINHTGSGDLTADVIDFETQTTIDELTYEMDGMSYLSQVKTDLDMDLEMEFTDKSSKFTLQENKLSLNALTLSFDGYYEMLENYDKMDLKLKADQTSFKGLLSLIPAFYYTGYESMVAKGSLGLKGFVKGRLDDTNLPAWDFSANVNGASIVYPDMPASIDNINVAAASQFPGGSNLDKMTIDVNKLTAEFVGNKINGDFHLKNPMTDPFIQSKLHANIDLSTLDKVYPLEETEGLNGKLTSDLQVKGRMSTLEKEEYDKFDASGSLLLEEFHYASEDLTAPVDIKEMLFEFSPQKLKLVKLNATMGESDFSMDGDVQNYMGYYFQDEDLKGVFNYHSDVLNVDELMPAESEESTTETASTEDSEDVPAAAEGEAEPVLVPAKIDFKLNTTIDELIYDGMDISKINGSVHVVNQEVILDNLAMNALDGTVNLAGKYNTQDHSTPKMDMEYDIKGIDIEKLSKNFLTIKKLAPVAEYARGNISSTFTMKTDLKPSFEPIFESLNGKGTLYTKEVRIEGFKPLEKLANVTKIKDLNNQTLNDLRVSFEFADGKVQVKPFNIKMGKINTKVSGTTSFEQEIDYTLNMQIPRDQIPGEALKLAEKAIAKVKNIPGIKMKELPAIIPVNAYVTNTIQDPKIKFNLKEKLMELGGNVKDQVKDMIDDKIDEAKDSVKAVVDEKVDEAKEKAKEEYKKRKKEILDNAQEQADNIKAEGKKVADRTRKEADKNAQKLIDKAGSNPFKKKAAEVSAKKLREEGEKSAKKIENEANKRADDVMKKARKKANSLE